MINLQESQTTEFKQLWKAEYLKTICTFSNSDGGDFYIGVCDDGTACSVKNVKSLVEILPNKINNRLGVLLFAKNPQHYFIQSNSKIGRFLTETDIQISDIIEGNLINQVDEIMDILRLKYLKAYISYEGTHRREKLEYPYEALREAIINALIHRDYTNTSNLQIKVYDDKLVMYNGALLSAEVPIEQFDKPHQSKSFNPLIPSVFYKVGFIENWGKGTLNIINECLKHELPKPTFQYEGTAVKTTFYKAQVELNETEQKSLVLLNNGTLSSKELVEQLGLKSLSGSLKNALKHLLEMKIIYYTILNKPKSRNKKYAIANKKINNGETK